MIVCHCKGATDRDIRRVADCGARSPHEVARACGAGSDCGSCTALVRLVLAHHAAAERRPASPLAATA